MDRGTMFGQLFRKTGEYSLIVALLAVAADHYDVVQLSNVPHFVNLLWLYVLVNGIAAARFMYVRRRKGGLGPKAVCPQCKSVLQQDVSFTCPQCGKLEFKKD